MFGSGERNVKGRRGYPPDRRCQLLRGTRCAALLPECSRTSALFPKFKDDVTMFGVDVQIIVNIGPNFGKKHE